MTERITSQMVDNSTISTIDYDLNQLENTQQQLSTGFTINQPSDNPVGAALSISLSGQISAYTAYGQNASQGTAWTDTASQALQSVEQVTESARELTVEAANGTMSPSDLNDAAQSVLSYISQIKQSADTQYDGSYVFSGSEVQTQPYNTTTTPAAAAGEDTYSGNDQSISYSIGPSTQVQVSANLQGVLGNGNTGGLAKSSSYGGGAVQSDGSGGLLATLRTIYNDMTGTNGGTQTDLGKQLTNLDTNLNSIQSLQATVGATQDRLQLASSRITSMTTTDQTELGNVEDTDVAKATVTFSSEQASYQAALQSTADIIQTSLMSFLQA